MRRQTPESPYTHYDGSWESLVGLVEEHFDKAEQGYRDGVLEVPVPASGFHCPVVNLNPGDVVHGVFDSRREGEDPRIHTLAVPNGEKTAAKFVRVILYSNAVLTEDDDASFADSDWEIISINASLVEDEPHHFLSMMANHFGADGGTDTKMDDSKFVAALKKSYLFWFDKAMAGR